MADINNVQQDINQLKEGVRTLTARVSELEARSVKMAPLMTTPPVPPLTSGLNKSVAAKPKTKNVASGLQWTLGVVGFLLLYGGFISFIFPLIGLGLIALAIFWPWKMAAQEKPAVGAGPGAVTPKPIHKHEPSAFERDLAKHWYSWLGIISLVVGITLLLNYALSSYGVTGRIITAYAAAVMLFGLAAWFHRRYHPFAMVLQSGAWATTFLSTYALHIAAGGPVTSAVWGGILLEVVVAAMLVAALVQNSRAMAGGAFLLGFFAVAVNGATSFTLAANALLALGLVLVATYRRWTTLIVPGTVITYIVHAVWLSNNFRDIKDLATQSTLFLIIYVLIFGAGHWLTNAAEETAKRMAIVGTVANLGAFYVLLNTTLRAVGTEQQWMGTIYLAIVVAVLAIVADRWKSRGYLRAPYLLFAIGFLTLGLAQKFSGPTLLLSWVIECVVLLGIGLAANMRAARIAAYIVTLITTLSLLPTLGSHQQFGTLNISAAWINGALLVIAITILSEFYHRRVAIISAAEKYAPAIMIDLAAIVAMVLLVGQWPVAWAIPGWMVISAGLFIGGLRRNDTNLRTAGAIATIITILALWATVLPAKDMAGSIGVHSRLLAGIWVAAWLSLLAALSHRQAEQLPAGEKHLWQGYAWATTLVVTAMFGFEITNKFLSVAWGVEGVALYLGGFALQSRLARSMGLTVMALTIAKVYLLDVSQLDKPYQILSFIVLGIILLGIGFLYNRWRQQSRPTTTS